MLAKPSANAIANNNQYHLDLVLLAVYQDFSEYSLKNNGLIKVDK